MRHYGKCKLSIENSIWYIICEIILDINITITSTEYQQNVGYYLEEVESGGEVIITISKPTFFC